MKNKKVLNKKISTEISIGIILLVAALIGVVFYLQNKKEAVQVMSEIKQSQIQNQQNNLRTENQQNQAQQNDGETKNQQNQAQNGLTEVDKNKLVQAFVVYIKTLDDSKHPEKSSYLNKNLYVRINKNTDNYLNGTMLIVGSENISAPYFLAFKQGNIWKVVFNGQDIPDCNLVEPLNFPSEIVAKCYDVQSNQEKAIL